MRIYLIDAHRSVVWRLERILVYIFEASEARANLQIYMAAIPSQQICVVRDNPIIADNDAIFDSGLKPAASPVNRVPILNYYRLSAHLLGIVPHAGAQLSISIAAT